MASEQHVVDGSRLMDKQWEELNRKTFTKWVNVKLKSRGIAEVASLAESFKDGVALIQLLEIIGDESLGKFNKNPKMRLHRVENLNRALEFIKQRGVNLTNIGAEDIVDGNEKLVLGMIWTIILRFTIAEISEGDLNAKEGLLLWCQRKTNGYKDVSVKDFTFSWVDGLAFCALIHRHRPDLIDFDILNKSNKIDNLTLAFDVAEKHLNIPKLLEPEDIVNIAKPDERSIITYVAQYFHAFASLNKVETAGRRVAKFVTVMQSYWEMKTDYEKRVKAWTEAIHTEEQVWEGTLGEDVATASGQYGELKKFKRTLKRDWSSEKKALVILFGNIQAKLKTYNLKPYVPSEGFSLANLDQVWDSLIQKENTRRQQLTDTIRRLREQLKHRFADAATGFIGDLNQVNHSLSSLDGELEAQLALIHKLTESLGAQYDSRLEEITKLQTECQDAHVDENEFTVYDVDDLSYELQLIRVQLQSKASFIENQLVASKMTNLTPQQIEEFESTFRHFDKDSSNTLNQHEFKAGLAGLDIFVEDSEFEKVFHQVSQNNDQISFEQFVQYMVSITEDKSSAEQLQESFKTLAGGKDVVTEMDLKIGQVSADVIQSITQHFKKNGEGYEFRSFIESSF